MPHPKWVNDSECYARRGVSGEIVVKRDRVLKQAPAVLLPTALSQRSGSGAGCAGAFGGCDAGEPTMNPGGVVIIPELFQFPVQIRSVPEEGLIEVLAPDRADQAFHKRM